VPAHPGDPARPAVPAYAGDPAAPAARRLDPQGTVLITGGTGALGGVVARHLVTTHGVRHVVLASRRGTDSEGAADLEAELRELGAQVTIAACDVADRDAMADLVAGIPAEHPLTAVVHAAGLPGAGMIGSLTPDQMDQVLRPKVDGAWHLHELTSHHDLAAFILFSSVAGVLDVAAQGSGNYAAANAFLDGLAHYRRAQGLPALSLAWGPWAQDIGMAPLLGETGRHRFARAGIKTLPPDQGMALLDTLLETESLDEAMLVAAPLDVTRLQAPGEMVPALLRDLARPDRQAERNGQDGTDSLAGRLAGLEQTEQEQTLLKLVLDGTASVLGHAAAGSIDAARPFSDLGFDSLTAMELRNHLTGVTGLRLPVTLVFDHPTPLALAHHLRVELVGNTATPSAGIFTELDRLEATLAAVDTDEDTRDSIATRLRTILSRWAASTSDTAGDATDTRKRRLESATLGEVLDLIDAELGNT
jgi:NAD(P)-dependent dehydrogenase (short-subunit alcohol dehydrogenase family)